MEPYTKPPLRSSLAEASGRRIEHKMKIAARVLALPSIFLKIGGGGGGGGGGALVIGELPWKRKRV